MRSSSAAIRLLSLLLFLLLVSIITFWAMQLLAPRGAIAPHDALGENGRPPLPIAARLFGARNTGVADATPPPINVRVLGVLQAGRHGVAVLGVNERPVAAYAVNQKIGNGSVLRAVENDRVIIEHRGKKVEFPAPKRYSLDILSSNAGNSRLPQGLPDGIEAADDMPPAGDDVDGLDGAASAGVPDDGTMPPDAGGGMPASMGHPDVQPAGEMPGGGAGASMMRDNLLEENAGDQPYEGDPDLMNNGVPPDFQGDEPMEGAWPEDVIRGQNGLSPEEQAAAMNAVQQARGRTSSGNPMNTGYHPNGMTQQEYEMQQSISQELDR